jgi:predicted nucleic acid-binding protein
VIVLDTSILSLAFRRRKTDAQPPEVVALREFIAADAPLTIPGVVLQELLSGVRSQEQFHDLERLLAGFRIFLAAETHHVHAAQISNACRHKGIACSTIDALIAAMTIDCGGRLFTSDADFRRIASHCGLKLLGLPA